MGQAGSLRCLVWFSLVALNGPTLLIGCFVWVFSIVFVGAGCGRSSGYGYGCGRNCCYYCRTIMKGLGD